MVKQGVCSDQVLEALSTYCKVPKRKRSKLRCALTQHKERGELALIFPRRKMGQNQREERSGPVWLTTEMVLSLAVGPLSQAASYLGISATALKKACRQLGIERWPYSRSQQADASSARPSISLEESETSGVATPETLEAEDHERKCEELEAMEAESVEEEEELQHEEDYSQHVADTAQPLVPTAQPVQLHATANQFSSRGDAASRAIFDAHLACSVSQPPAAQSQYGQPGEELRKQGPSFQQDLIKKEPIGLIDRACAAEKLSGKAMIGDEKLAALSGCGAGSDGFGTAFGIHLAGCLESEEGQVDLDSDWMAAGCNRLEGEKEDFSGLGSLSSWLNTDTRPAAEPRDYVDPWPSALSGSALSGSATQHSGGYPAHPSAPSAYPHAYQCGPSVLPLTASGPQPLSTYCGGYSEGWAHGLPDRSATHHHPAFHHPAPAWGIHDPEHSERWHHVIFSA